MAVNYLKARAAAENPRLRDRVQACLVETALQVMAEDAATAGHAERVELAHAVLSGARTADLPVMLCVATNATILGAVTKEPTTDAAAVDVADGDLEFVIESAWSALAGFSK